MNPIRLQRVQVFQVAAHAMCDPRSVMAAYAGRSVRYGTLVRVVRAARALGLPDPPRSELIPSVELQAA